LLFLEGILQGLLGGGGRGLMPCSLNHWKNGVAAAHKEKWGGEEVPLVQSWKKRKECGKTGRGFAGVNPNTNKI